MVQIVHYSDIHLRGRAHAEQLLAVERVRGRLPEAWCQGLATADRSALRAFEVFIREVVAGDPAWRGQPTWLVDTGDGTTFGDDESLSEWLLKWSPRFKAAAGRYAQQLMLFGNHDSWPGTFPMCAPHALETQRARLRNKWFRRELPGTPLHLPIPRTNGSRLELYLANTVDHRVWPAIFSWGWAALDQEWETGYLGAAGTVADALQHWSSTFPDSGHGSHFRILATHFPVCDAVQPGRYTELLRNRAVLANGLARNPSAQAPLVNLLLAGHTHVAHPAQGRWPQALHQADDPPLAGNMCQVVSASLSQMVVPAAGQKQPRNPPPLYPHQCTLLRIYRHPSEVPQLVIERIVVGRAASGPFAFLPISEADPQAYAEQMVAPLAA